MPVTSRPPAAWREGEVGLTVDLESRTEPG